MSLKWATRRLHGTKKNGKAATGDTESCRPCEPVTCPNGPALPPSRKEEGRQGGREGGGEQAFLWVMASLKSVERQAVPSWNTCDASQFHRRCSWETYLA